MPCPGKEAGSPNCTHSERLSFSLTMPVLTQNGKKTVPGAYQKPIRCVSVKRRQEWSSGALIFKQRRAAASRQLHAPFNASPPVQWERFICRHAAKEECSMSHPYLPVSSSKTLLCFTWKWWQWFGRVGTAVSKRTLCSATAGLTLSCAVGGPDHMENPECTHIVHFFVFTVVYYSGISPFIRH